MPTAAVLVLLLVGGAAAVVVGRQVRTRRRAAQRERLRRFVAAIEDTRPDPPSLAPTPPPAEDVHVDEATTAPTVAPVVPPDGLPTFADVGGMEGLKASLRDTVGLVLAHRDRARDPTCTALRFTEIRRPTGSMSGPCRPASSPHRRPV